MILSSFCILLITILVTKAQDDLIVTIKNGKIQGRKDLTIGYQVPYRVFQGIPYAEPPIGDLRFEPPLPKSDWDGVLDATEERRICTQVSLESSEDCLFLNVFIPEIETSVPLPVLVWIYGGGFITGNSHDKPDYLIERGIIFVSLNYRLGIFGFLSTGDLAAPGNAGLKDQQLALKWVRDNIEAFGGDPNNVTLFGQSAGSASVSYHMQSPLSQGLFQRAIMDSGVSLCSWGISRVAPEAAKSVAYLLSINFTDSRSLVQELKKRSQEELQSASLAVMAILLLQSAKDGFVFAPVVEPEHEGAFFTDKSYVLLANGNFSKVPVLLGFNSLEGACNITETLRLLLLSFDLQPELLIPKNMNIGVQTNETVKREVARKIKVEYFNNGFLVFGNLSIMEWITDDQFVRPIREFSLLTSKYTEVFLYHFAYKGYLGDPDMLFYFPTHTEELNYLFVSNNSGTQSDYLCRDRMITLWTNFAKFGDPTPEKIPLLHNIIWPYFRENLQYLKIGRNLEIASNPKRMKMNFWDYLYQQYGNPPYDTY